jgi:hypothetical protein
MNNYIRKSRRRSKPKSRRRSKRKSRRRSKRKSRRQSKRKSRRQSIRKHRLIGGVLNEKITGVTNHLPSEITSMIRQTIPVYNIDSITELTVEAQNTLQNLTIIVSRIKTEQQKMYVIREELSRSNRNQSTENQLNTFRTLDRQVKDVLSIMKNRMRSLINHM